MKKIDNLEKIFCVGMAKSGTHSINSIFENFTTSAHEPENRILLDLIIKHSNKQISDDEIINYVISKNIRLNLVVDSSHLNYFIIDYLIKLYPYSKYILTIRDCYSWVDSFINHTLSHPLANKDWLMLRDLRFGRFKNFHKDEAILEELDLYPLENYFKYWAEHNLNVITKIPNERLLIIKTNEISNSIKKLSQFSKIDIKEIEIEKTHVYENPSKYKVLNSINENYIFKISEKYCKDLMMQYFPEISKPDI